MLGEDKKLNILLCSPLKSALPPSAIIRCGSCLAVDLGGGKGDGGSLGGGGGACGSQYGIPGG